MWYCVFEVSIVASKKILISKTIEAAKVELQKNSNWPDDAKLFIKSWIE